MTDFARILKRTLESRGITQKWLADAANTKEATISRYITGVNKSPNVEILINIAKALDVSADYLLGISDIPKIKSDTSKEERILLSAMRKASSRDVAVIWQLLDPYISQNERGFLALTSMVDSDSKTG